MDEIWSIKAVTTGNTCAILEFLVGLYTTSEDQSGHNIPCAMCYECEEKTCLRPVEKRNAAEAAAFAMGIAAAADTT